MAQLPSKCAASVGASCPRVHDRHDRPPWLRRVPGYGDDLRGLTAGATNALPIWAALTQCGIAPRRERRMRFILLIKLARATAAKVEIFDAEDAARERWRAAAIAAVTGMPFYGRAVTSAQLFSGPPVGSKHEARKL